MSQPPQRPFHTASDAEIKDGEVSDAYFAQTVEILRHREDQKLIERVERGGQEKSKFWGITSCRSRGQEHYQP